MRRLAVDLGKARIGLAVSDDAHQITTPLPPLAAQGALVPDAAQVAEAARKQEAQAVVLGLPLENGEATRMASVARRFAALLESHGLKVDLVDETLTTYEAESALQALGLKASQRKKARDSEAACRILERFYQAGQNQPTHPSENHPRETHAGEIHASETQPGQNHPDDRP